MRVRARNTTDIDIPPSVRPFAPPEQLFITEGKEYEVHAIWTPATKGIVLVQIVDDLRYTSWLPIWLFDVQDPTLPDDWSCNYFREPDYVVLGPDFITRDEASYTAMVEHRPEQVQRFWERIRAHNTREEE